MQVITPDLVKGKKILIRLDLDVPLQNGEVQEEFRLKAGLPTLKLCIQNASKVIIIGHLGRPFETVEDEKKGIPSQFSLKPVHKWFESEIGESIKFAESLDELSADGSKICMLENTRFFHGEVPGADYHYTCISKTCDVDFAKHLASEGEFFVNEAFAAYRPAASTTILPTLLPHCAGLRFATEVEKLTQVRENPKKPFVAIMGGAKVEDKLPVIQILAKSADAVLVGGKLVHEIREQNIELPHNVMIASLNEDGFDISEETTQSWTTLIHNAAMIVWNGPLGKFEDPKNDQTKKVGEIVTSSSAESIVGGGDIISALNQVGLLDKISFVSTGGGAMLKFLSEGTLPTIDVLK